MTMLPSNTGSASTFRWKTGTFPVKARTNHTLTMQVSHTNKIGVIHWPCRCHTLKHVPIMLWSCKLLGKRSLNYLS